jgi:hypothetical protein
MIRTALRALAVAAPLLVFAASAPGCFGDNSGNPDAGGIDVSIPPIEAVLSVSPPSLDFGTVQVGARSAPLTVTATNTGSSATGALTMQLAGVDASAFVVDSDGCGGQVLLAGGTCAVKVHFAPQSDGPRAATITVAGVPGGSGVVTLSGAGAQAGALSLAPAAHDFGTVAVGAMPAPPAVTFTLKNGGAGATSAIALSLTGIDHGEFTLSNDLCSGKPIAAGAKCTVDVAFAPTSAGPKAATLTAMATQGTATASLSGTAGAGAALSLMPASHDFGSVTQGSTTPAQTFTLTNTGGVASGVPTFAFSGANAADFAAPAAANQCTSALAAGASCTLGVTFKATAASLEMATLTASATATTSATAALSGTGLAPAAIAIEPPTYDFNAVTAGTASPSVVFTVTNNGGVTTGALTASLSGTGASQFVVDGGNCNMATLAPAAKCTVSVHFLPAAATVGAVQASLGVGGMPGGATAATLTGTALAPAALAIAPASQPFGTISQGGSSSDVPFTVTNTGAVASGTVAVSLAGASKDQFALGMQNCNGVTLPPKGTCTVNVHFSPTMLGPLAALLDASATPGGTASAGLGGTGASAAQVVIAPPPSFAGFGTAGYPVTTGPYTFTVTNNGGVTTGALAVTLGGTATSQFKLTTATAAPCPNAMLAPGASCTVEVTFAPTSGTSGVQQASLDVSGTPGGNPSAALTGTAVTAALTITPPTTPFPGFGSAAPGFPSAPFTFTITNTGGAVTGTPLAVSIVQQAPNQYSLNTATQQACPTSLAPGRSCTVDVTFAPTVSTGTPQATLTATATPGGSPTLGLSGTAVAAPQVKIQPPPNFLGFGTVTFGQSATATFSLTNTGGLPTGAPTIATDSPDYTIPMAANMCAGAAVQPGVPCNFDVKFAPSLLPPGPEPSMLTASATPGNSDAYQLTGTGFQTPASIALDVQRWAPPATIQGSAAPPTQTFTVTNNGQAQTNKLSITGLSTGFSVQTLGNDTCSGLPVSGGGNCSFVVQFAPTGNDTPGPTGNVTMTVTDSATDLQKATLSSITLSPTYYLVTTPPGKYGTVAPGSSTTITFTVTNYGAGMSPLLDVMQLQGLANYPYFSSAGTTCIRKVLQAYGGANTCQHPLKFAPPVGTAGTLPAGADLQPVDANGTALPNAPADPLTATW